MTANCPKCRAPLSAHSRHCPTCKADAGAPNVRDVSSEDEKSSLFARFEAAKADAIAAGCESEFAEFILFIQEKACVIVNMPASVARDMASNPRDIYLNYEKLVGTGSRLPASMANDKQRRGIGGFIFGSIAENIVYGFMGFSEASLKSYGRIACQMKTVAIADRVTFLEENSYPFFARHQHLICKGEFPKGYRAVWDNKQNLVLAKLGKAIRPGYGENDFKRLLLTPGDRDQEEFLEAHIYEGFNIYAIEQMSDIGTSKKDKTEDTDARIALELFQKAKNHGNT